MTKPLSLCLYDNEISLQLIRFWKRYDVSIYDLHIFDYDNDRYHRRIMREMSGVNFSSLRHLYLGAEEFNFEVFKDCKKLTHFKLSCGYVLDDVLKAKKMKTFLSFNKDTLESLHLAPDKNTGETYDIFPEDLNSWPNLKYLHITHSDLLPSRIIESSTLHYLVIFYSPNDNIVIKCPNLKGLKIVDIPSYNDLQLKPSDKYDFDYTCHPSELQKVGFVVEVSNDCEIGICMY